MFGRYALLDELGSGGMGVVYRARDAAAGRIVALKVMSRADAEAAARFQREVRAMARLSHPNIVQVHDVGEVDGRPYYTMDYVEGPTLGQVITDMKSVPARPAARITRDLARALEAAHARGTLHRDVKPGNILLAPVSDTRSEELPAGDTSIHLGKSRTASYRVMLTDFGLAKEMDATAQFTLTGAVLGTPAYMSPEQAAGEPADVRSDVWSAGVVLYEMLSGRQPFRGENYNALMHRVRNEDPETLSGLIPADVRTICQKAMTREPGRRYQTARELADDLDRYLRGEAIAARPASAWYRLRKRVARHKALSAGIGALLLAACAAGGWALGPATVVVHGEARRVWPPGVRRMTFVREGYLPQAAEVSTVPWGTVPWDPPLVADHGFVEVSSEPPGADVEVFAGERAVRGRAGEKVRVPAGTHALRVALAGYEAHAGIVAVPPGETAPLRVALVHEKGALTVTCHPAGVRMTVAGRSYALPVENLPLDTGRYELRFDAGNCFGRSARVEILKGAPAEVHASLNSRELWRFDPPEAATGVVVGDVEGWGSPAVMIACGDGSVMAVTGRNQEPIWSVRVASAATGLPVAADFDGDGLADVAVGARDGRLRALSGRDGTLLWERAVPTYTGATPAVADLDGDGVPDAAVSGGEIGRGPARLAAVSGRDGRVLWDVRFRDSLLSPPIALDADGDGAADIVAGCAGEECRIAAWSGRTGKRLWQAEAGAEIFAAPAAADLDGDGRPEIVAITMEALVAVGGAGAPLWTHRLPLDAIGSPVLADLDGDGAPECVFSAEDGTLTALRLRDRSTLWTARAGGGLEMAPIVADLDGDGAAEVAVAALDGEVAVFSGSTGGPAWTFRLGSDLGCSPVAADLNADGAADLVVPSWDRGVTAICGRDVGPRWVAPLSASGVSARPLAADVDGDGATDALAASGRDLAAFSGADGRRLWTRSFPQDLDGAPVTAVLDGVPAAAILTGVVEVAAVRLRDGVVLWEASAGDSRGATLAAADFDADGCLDFLAAGDGFVTALSGRDGRQLWQRRFAEGAASTPAIADLDGDGDPDVLVGSPDGLALALDGASGRTLREFAPGGDASPAVFVFGDALIMAPESGGLRAFARDGAALWKSEAVDAVFESFLPLGADFAALSPETTLAALHGADGRMLWAISCTGQTTLAVAPDADGDGRSDILLGPMGAVHSSRDGSLLASWSADEFAAFAPLRDGCLAATDAWLLERRAAPALHPDAASLAADGSWSALERFAQSLPDRRLAARLRGLARLRAGGAPEAASAFREARSLGFRPVEMAADEVEAILLVGEDPAPALRDLPDAAVPLLLNPGRLSEEARRRLAAAAAGETPALLLLAGRPDEALKALPKGDTFDLGKLLLRVAAKREKGNRSGAIADLRDARRLAPWNPVVRALEDAFDE